MFTYDRALKNLFQHPGVPRDELFKDAYLKKIVSMLTMHDIDQNLPELAASIIARCCVNAKQQAAFEKLGAVEAILELTFVNDDARVKEACLDALAAFVRNNRQVAKSLVEYQVQVSNVKNVNGSILSLLIRNLREKRSSIRLISAACYANIYRTGIIPEKEQEIVQYVIPTLIKLFQDQSETVREKAPLVFAYLVSENDELQRAASEADAVSKLSQLLFTSYVACSDDNCSNMKKKAPKAFFSRMCENSLVAIAAICSLREECRKSVIESKILPVVVKSLENPNSSIRVAACQAARSLSRSVKFLRTSLVDAGIALPLFQLLSDKSPEVQSIASATLCNIVLDFSPMKKIVIENGGVEKLVELSRSADVSLRMNAVWALKNLLYQSDSDIKQSVMEKLGFKALEALIEDTDIRIQEQALNLLRNLACKNEADIELCFNGFGPENLVRLVEKKLVSQNEDIVLQSLYVVVNISTGSEGHKVCMMSSAAILKAVLENMAHDKPSIRIATLWIIVNLTWVDDNAAEVRVQKLRDLGFEEKLAGMATDVDIEIRDRAKTALQHFAPTP